MTPSLPDTMCPEKQLVICCARVGMPPEMAEKIRDLANEPLDWDFLLSGAAVNSLTPLLHLHLNAIAADRVPAQQMERLRVAARANAANSLLLTSELIKIMGELDSQGTAAIPYKGPVLAAQAYGDVALRQFEDLDIIVRQRELAKAHEVMLGLGYRAKFPWLHSAGAAQSVVPGEYIYTHDSRQTMVELHTEQSMRHFPLPPDLDVFTQRLVSVRVGGRDIKTFSAEDALPILCVHGTKHFWEKLSWIVDISEMIESHPNLNWHETFRRAESLHAQRMLAVGLALASKLLGTELPEEILSRATNDRAAAALSGEVAGRLLRLDAQPLRAGARLRFRQRMVPGAFAGWRYALRLATSPSEEDREMVRLPGPLVPFYIVLRPLRLLLKYGGRRQGKKRP